MKNLQSSTLKNAFNILPRTEHMIASKYNFTDKYFPNIFLALSSIVICVNKIFTMKKYYDRENVNLIAELIFYVSLLSSFLSSFES